MSTNHGAPLLFMKVEAQTEADRPQLVSVLSACAESDPKASFVVDSGSGEMLLGGISELHLDHIIAHLMSMGISVKLGAPQVAYRAAITRSVRKDYTHKKLTAGKGQFARVILEIEPNQTGAGNAFISRIRNNSIPERFIPGVEKGVNTVLTNGPLARMPVVDLKVTLVDGAYHDEDSTPLTFEIATRAALREAIEVAGAVLLEPIMNVEITSPEEYIGSVIADLHSRRGIIVGTSMRNDLNIINAKVPLANMFGYANYLKKMSQGTASFLMDYSRYHVVPPPTDDPDKFPPAVGKRA